MNRYPVIATAAALALALPGCGANSQPSTSHSKPAPTLGEIYGVAEAGIITYCETPDRSVEELETVTSEIGQYAIARTTAYDNIPGIVSDEVPNNYGGSVYRAMQDFLNEYPLASGLFSQLACPLPAVAKPSATK